MIILQTLLNISYFLMKILSQHQKFLSFDFRYVFDISHWLIGLVGRVFANGPGDWGSNPGQVIQKT